MHAELPFPKHIMTTTKSTKGSRRVRRSPENKTLTISLSVELDEAIKAAAAADGRNVSAWIRRQLEQATQEQQPAPLRVVRP